MTFILTLLTYHYISYKIYLVILNIFSRGDAMITRYERQLKKGVLEILVLQLLFQEEMYGYQIIMRMKDISEGMFDMREGTLYPILYRLEDEQLVESQWSMPCGKEVSRKYYHITPKGIETLKSLKCLWKDFSLTVDKIMGE